MKKCLKGFLAILLTICLFFGAIVFDYNSISAIVFSPIIANAAGVTDRDDGVWLWPLPAANHIFTDWAGCNWPGPCPFDGCNISCGVNHETPKINGKECGHQGVDLSAGIGTTVYASASGRIVAAGYYGSRGNTIIIEHESGEAGYSYYSIYQHLSSFIKTSGSVSVGDVIAYSGNSGGNYGAHLHFAIIRGEIGLGDACFKYDSYGSNAKWLLSKTEKVGMIVTNPKNGDANLSSVRAHAGSVSYTFNPSEVKIGGHTHSYSEQYEADHPHKIYMKCSCGEWYYTGKTRTVAGCLDCERPTSAAVGRTIYNGHIYEVYNTSTTWKNAKTYAEEMGGHLVTITSAEEQAAITSISHGTMNALWIGATDEKEEGKWKWVTDEPFSYSNWTDGEPNNSGGAENYAHLSYNAGGKWNDLALSNPNAAVGGFIVEYEPQLTDTVQENGHIYEVYKGQTNWAAAKEYAEKKGGYLVTITSSDEQALIYQNIISKYKIGIWIGATDVEKEGTWKWVSGEPFNYANWNQGQPDNYDNKEHYAQIYGNNGAWNDLSLSEPSVKGFIVEYDCEHKWNLESVTVEATCTQTGIAVVKCTKCGQTQSVGYRANGDLLDSASYEWTTTPPPANAVQVEKKTQYRYSKKETTESDSSSLSGWTRRTDVTNPVTEYGAWKNENPTTSKPTESDTLKITKSYVSAYNYYHICNNYYDGCWNVDSIPYGSGSHTRHTISVPSQLPPVGIPDKGGKQFYGGQGNGAPSCSSNFYLWIYDGETYTYEFQTRSVANKYFYYRWKAFSDWQDTAVTADDNTKVETRTVYRYYAPQTVSGDHVWNSGKITKKATCAVEGIKTYTCTVCNATKTESIAKTDDHKWATGKVTTVPTCKEAGIKTFTCSVCNSEKTEPIAKLTVHPWDDGVVTKEATILTEGEMTYTCTVCKATRKEVIPVKITPTTPTIAVGSATAAPGSSVSVDVSIANNPGINTFALGFSYDSDRLSLKNVAVDSALGGQFHYAKRAVWLNSSDTKYNGVILKLTFDVVANAKEGDTKVTVTYQPGDISNYNEDDVMFAVSSGTITVGDHVHTWDAGKVTKAATCTVDGVKSYSCTVCKETKTEVIKATGHQAITDKAVAATCTKDGKTEGNHCSVCGTVLKAQTTIKASGHKWDGGKVTKAATCTANGVKTFTCSVCKETKTEAIKASGHKAVTDKAVAATCTKDGKTEGSHCSVCSTVLKAQTTLSATGHKWDGEKVTKVATCAATGIKSYTCTVCKTTKTETIPKTTDHKWDSGKVTKASTCAVTGVKTYTCTVCKTTKTETIAKTNNHSWDEGHFVTPDRKNLTAIESYACAICKQTKTEKYKYTLGDVDQDNQITAADARLALRRSVGLENFEINTPQYLSCDVDFDSNVSAADARLILRASVGLEDPLKWM